MNWKGQQPIAEDGYPYWWLSECGRFTIARVMTNEGWFFESWEKRRDEQGRPDMPVQLACRMTSAHHAQQTCERRAHELAT